MISAKQYLEKYMYYEDIIINKKDKLRDLEYEGKYSYGKINYGVDKVQTTPDTDKIGAIQVRIEELQEQIKFYQSKQQEILDTIEIIGNRDMYNLLYKYYIEEKRLYIVAAEMKKAYSTIRNMHVKALKEIEKLICQ